MTRTDHLARRGTSQHAEWPRAQRAFFSQLARDAGHHIVWVRMDPDRNMAASAAAHHGDLAPLQEMLDQLTDLPHPSGPPGPPCRPAA